MKLELSDFQAKLFLAIIMQYAAEDPRMKTRSAVFLSDNKDCIVPELIKIVNKLVKENGIVV